MKRIFKSKRQKEYDRERERLQEEQRLANEKMEELLQERQRLLDQYQKNTDTLCQLQEQLEEFLNSKTFS